MAKLCIPRSNEKGYQRLQPKINGRPKVLFIHRAVCLAWIPNKLNKKTINHRNMIVSDNRVVNLEWMTNTENRNHRLGGPTPVVDDSLIEELWRDVPGFDHYIASNKGRVAKVMQLKPNDRNYMRIKIQVDGLRKDYYIQRLIAEAWIRPINDNEVITWINADVSDNRVVNLKIITQQELIKGLNDAGKVNHADQRGVKNGRAKLTTQDVIEIRKRYDDGESPIFNSK